MGARRLRLDENPPFGGRNGLEPWLEKFFEHGNGIALTPDRTSAPWFQKWAPLAMSLLFLPKVRFLRPDGTEGKSPSTGTALWAAGLKGHAALKRARHIGLWTFPIEQAASDAGKASAGRERSDRVGELQSPPREITGAGK